MAVVMGAEYMGPAFLSLVLISWPTYRSTDNSRNSYFDLNHLFSISNISNEELLTNEVIHFESRLIIKRNESRRNFDQPGLNGKEKEIKNIMRSRSVVTASRNMKELKEQGIKLRDLDL